MLFVAEHDCLETSLPLTQHRHDDLRHGLYTMYTDWIVVDNYTKEIELKECWACRRKGKGNTCLIKGRRILPRDPINPESRYKILPPNGGANGGGNGGHGGGSGRRHDDDDDDDTDRNGGRHGDGYEDEEVSCWLPAFRRSNADDAGEALR